MFLHPIKEAAVKMTGGISHSFLLATLVFSLLIISCSHKSDESSGGGSASGQVKIAVTGFSGSSPVYVTLDANDDTTTTITANQTYTPFDIQGAGETYSLRVDYAGNSQQTCTLDSYSGTMGSSDVTVNMYCSATSYTISGSINGLREGSRVGLSINGGEAELTPNGTFTLSTHVASGAPSTVTFSKGVGYVCTLINNTSAAMTANITNVEASCQATSMLYDEGSRTGDMGGRVGANQLCLNKLTNLGFGSNSCSTPIAFLSVSATDEIRDIPSLNPTLDTTKPIYETGSIKVADDWADLLDGTIDNPISIIGNKESWWSGSNTDGSIKDLTCRGWTTTNTNGYYGYYLFKDTNWINFTNNACFVPNHLLCLCIQETHQLSGTVSGLTGTLVLSLGTEEITLTANGAFYSSQTFETGDAYSVTVDTHPSGQTCAVSHGSGTYSSSVEAVTVTCTTDGAAGTGGATEGAGGSGGATESSGGSTGSAGSGSSGSAGSGQAGAAGNGEAGSGAAGSGVAGSAGSTPTTFSIGGTVSGLTVGTLHLSLNSGAQTKAITANGAFTFDTEINSGSSYTVSIGSEPSLVDCSVSNGSGTASADVSNITITCEGIAHFFYPTSSAIAANFGNRAASSAVCAAEKEAHYSNLPCDGTIAFLSYDASDEVWDFPTLYSLDISLELQDASNSNLKIADNWTDLLDGTLDNAFSVNWWSGTLADGSYNTGFNCSGWTSNNAMDDVGIGQSGQTSGFWSGTSEGMCDQTFRLMCLCYQQ